MILKMSDMYASEGFSGADPEVDLTSLQGTNCYCSEESAEAIAKALDERIAGTDETTINHIDTGDYHYISALTTARVKEDQFALVLFDNHPDMETPALDSSMLSCAGWARKAFADNEAMTQVFMVGINPDLELEFLDLVFDGVIALDSEEFRGNVHTDDKPLNKLISKDVRDMTQLIEGPVYISLDLDVLSQDFFRTDWDQGRMSPDEVKAVINEIASRHRIIGVDICGGMTVSKGATDEILAKNREVREDFDRFFKELISKQ